jgi:hypothetical protein
MTKNRNTVNNFSYPQVRQRWFSVCIFPPGLLFGFTLNRPQQATFHTNTVSPPFEITKN